MFTLVAICKGFLHGFHPRSGSYLRHIRAPGIRSCRYLQGLHALHPSFDFYFGRVSCFTLCEPRLQRCEPSRFSIASIGSAWLSDVSIVGSILMSCLERRSLSLQFRITAALFLPNWSFLFPNACPTILPLSQTRTRYLQSKTVSARTAGALAQIE